MCWQICLNGCNMSLNFVVWVKGNVLMMPIERGLHYQLFSIDRSKTTSITRHVKWQKYACVETIFICYNCNFTGYLWYFLKSHILRRSNKFFSLYFLNFMRTFLATAYLFGLILHVSNIVFIWSPSIVILN